MSFIAIKVVRQQGTGSGVYLNQYVTNTQHSALPFSSQPVGLQPIGCFSVLLVSHASI